MVKRIHVGSSDRRNRRKYSDAGFTDGKVPSDCLVQIDCHNVDSSSGSRVASAVQSASAMGVSLDSAGYISVEHLRIFSGYASNNRRLMQTSRVRLHSSRS